MGVSMNQPIPTLILLLKGRGRCVFSESRSQAEMNSMSTEDKERELLVHLEYALYGHFFHLRHLFERVENVRFHFDQAGVAGAGRSWGRSIPAVACGGSSPLRAIMLRIGGEI